MAPPLFRLDKAVKRFGGVVAVDGVSMEVESRQIVSIIGPNGAGKSTLLNLATGVMAIDEGGRYLGAEDVTDLGSTAMSRRGVARTFQNIRLFKSLSVVESVAMGMFAVERPGVSGLIAPGILDRPRRRRWWRRSHEILDALGLADHAKERAADLPPVEQRRVEIARALVSDPRLIFLDEPCAGMHDSELDDFGTFLERLRDDQAVAIVLIEHHIDLVLDVSDHVYMLHDGSLVAAGTPADLDESGALRAVYLA